MLREPPFETEKHLYVVEGITLKVVDKRSGFVAKRIRFNRAVFPRIYANEDMVFAASY